MIFYDEVRANVQIQDAIAVADVLVLVDEVEIPRFWVFQLQFSVYLIVLESIRHFADEFFFLFYTLTQYGDFLDLLLLVVLHQELRKDFQFFLEHLQVGELF